MNYRYFTQSDFDRCNPPCKIEDMDQTLMNLLDEARFKAGIPFVINSAYRTKEHELSKGRDGTSSHIKGLAVDIRVRNSRERYLILKALVDVDFHRIGVGNTFIHVDLDLEKDENVIWTYA